MFGYFKPKYDPFPNPIKCVVPDPNPTFSTVLSQHSKLKLKDKVEKYSVNIFFNFFLIFNTENRIQKH